MSSNSPDTRSEIDLIKLTETIWYGKWIILSFTITFLLVSFVLNKIIPNKSFTAVTEVKPITSSTFNKFKQYNMYINSLNERHKNIKGSDVNRPDETNFFFPITPDLLLELFLEEIDLKPTFQDGIRKFNFFERSNYKKDKDYENSISKLASKIELFRPTKNNKNLQYPKITFTFNNIEKWEKTLNFVSEKANKAVIKNIYERFSINLKTAIQNKKFQIEDVTMKIEKERFFHEKKYSYKLAFLREQASIARKLNIRKSKMEGQSDKNFLSVREDTPYYFYGYEAIEEEINQIEKRLKKKYIIQEEEYEVETLLDLEKELAFLKNDNSSDRALELFSNTPINDNAFNTVFMEVKKTKYTYHSKANIYNAISIVLGSFFGIIFVLLKSALKNRKISMQDMN